MLVLFQAEWCPFSAAVRQRLTELGLDFVARQVEPWPEDRTTAGEIPTLEVEEGERYVGSDEIFEYLARREGWEHERDHRERWLEHADARRVDATGRILAKDAPLDALRGPLA
jgi:glutathione S-transferase